MRYLREGRIKRIHVDRRILAQNLKQGKNRAALTVQMSDGPIKASRVEILGPSTLVQAGRSAPRPLSCGARVWIETHALVGVYA